MKLSRSEFLDKILQILDDVAASCKKQGESRPGVWTGMILNSMAKLAKECEIEFYPENHASEWLFDATFWQPEGDGIDDAGIVACAEIEWDNRDDGEHRDYKKVLVARTEIPIFITEAYGEQDTKKQINDRLKLAKQFAGNPRPAIFVYDNESGKWFHSKYK